MTRPRTRPSTSFEAGWSSAKPCSISSLASVAGPFPTRRAAVDSSFRRLRGIRTESTLEEVSAPLRSNSTGWPLCHASLRAAPSRSSFSNPASDSVILVPLLIRRPAPPPAPDLVEGLERNEEASAAGSLAMQDDATPMHRVVVPYRHSGWIVEDRLLYLPLFEFVLVPKLVKHVLWEPYQRYLDHT